MQNSTKCNSNYRLSFGIGGLYVKESETILNLYVRVGDWGEVMDIIVDQNTLQFNSKASTKRIAREICTRLRSLMPDEITYFLDADFQDQAIITWISICRTYQFIEEFVTSVIIESFASYRLDLKNADFEFFFDEQTQWHPELENLSNSTKNNLRRGLFRMMREVGILSSNSQIRQVIPSSSLKNIKSFAKDELSRFLPGVLT